MATSPVKDDRYYLSVTKLLGIGFANSLDLRERVAELNHKINSPLSAIRNALYLAGRRTQDRELLKYLELADEAVTSISRALEDARCAAGEMALRQRPTRRDEGDEPAAA
jgi:signal transduction histidine kinase